jgi:thioredoxin-related protein
LVTPAAIGSKILRYTDIFSENSVMQLRPLFSALCLALAIGSSNAAQAAAETSYAGNLAAQFDPHRDAAKDLADAIALAQSGNKRIVVDVGGEWCIWCLRMDKFMQGNEQIKTAVNSGFVWVKINYSEENNNKDVLAQFPKIKGYPHLFVLDKNGTLLQSQSTGPFEQDKSYSADRILDFLHTWAAH